MDQDPVNPADPLSHNLQYAYFDVASYPKILPKPGALPVKYLGRLYFALYNRYYPDTVRNFLMLCEGKIPAHPFRPVHESPVEFQSSEFERPEGYEDNYWYKNSLIHRVIPGFALQGGDITNFDGTGGASIFRKYENGPFPKEENQANLLYRILRYRANKRTKARYQLQLDEFQVEANALRKQLKQTKWKQYKNAIKIITAMNAHLPQLSFQTYLHGLQIAEDLDPKLSPIIRRLRRGCNSQAWDSKRIGPAIDENALTQSPGDPLSPSLVELLLKHNLPIIEQPTNPHTDNLMNSEFFSQKKIPVPRFIDPEDYTKFNLSIEMPDDVFGNVHDSDIPYDLDGDVDFDSFYVLHGKNGGDETPATKWFNKKLVTSFTHSTLNPLKLSLQMPKTYNEADRLAKVKGKPYRRPLEAIVDKLNLLNLEEIQSEQRRKKATKDFFQPKKHQSNHVAGIIDNHVTDAVIHQFMGKSSSDVGLPAGKQSIEQPKKSKWEYIPPVLRASEVGSYDLSQIENGQQLYQFSLENTLNRLSSRLSTDPDALLSTGEGYLEQLADLSYWNKQKENKPSEPSQLPSSLPVVYSTEDIDSIRYSNIQYDYSTEGEPPSSPAQTTLSLFGNDSYNMAKDILLRRLNRISVLDEVLSEHEPTAYDATYDTLISKYPSMPEPAVPDVFSVDLQEYDSSDSNSKSARSRSRSQSKQQEEQQSAYRTPESSYIDHRIKSLHYECNRLQQSISEISRVNSSLLKVHHTYQYGRRGQVGMANNGKGITSQFFITLGDKSTHLDHNIHPLIGEVFGDHSFETLRLIENMALEDESTIETVFVLDAGVVDPETAQILRKNHNDSPFYVSLPHLVRHDEDHQTHPDPFNPFHLLDKSPYIFPRDTRDHLYTKDSGHLVYYDDVLDSKKLFDGIPVDRYSKLLNHAHKRVDHEYFTDSDYVADTWYPGNEAYRQHHQHDPFYLVDTHHAPQRYWPSAMVGNILDPVASEVEYCREAFNAAKKAWNPLGVDPVAAYYYQTEIEDTIPAIPLVMASSSSRNQNGDNDLHGSYHDYVASQAQGRYSHALSEGIVEEMPINERRRIYFTLYNDQVVNQQPSSLSLADKAQHYLFHGAVQLLPGDWTTPESPIYQYQRLSFGLLNNRLTTVTRFPTEVVVTMVYCPFNPYDPVTSKTVAIPLHQSTRTLSPEFYDIINLEYEAIHKRAAQLNQDEMDVHRADRQSITTQPQEARDLSITFNFKDGSVKHVKTNKVMAQLPQMMSITPLEPPIRFPPRRRRTGSSIKLEFRDGKLVEVE